VQHTFRRSPRWSTSVAVASSLLAPVAAVLTGCTSGDGMMPTMSVSPPSAMQSRAEPKGEVQPPSAGGQQNTLTMTGQQVAYLDALKASGVKPSSDLLALSIGSYVCQARAAKQSDQAVRDYVMPMVRNDVRNTEPNAVGPPPSEVNAVTDDYIRVATERLC
jgi:hypothetical protein